MRRNKVGLRSELAVSGRDPHAKRDLVGRRGRWVLQVRAAKCERDRDAADEIAECDERDIAHREPPRQNSGCP